MKPIFCGNFEYDARQSDLERLFRRYGKVDRVDMKSGFAFVYMEDERDAEDAIRALDRIEFGRKGRKLRVEWTKQERTSRRPESSRKSSSSSNSRPSKTLFVINFDPYHTRTRDIEKHFDPYGKILNVRIRRNFAFVQYENQEDATKALDATNMSKLLDRVITVEYAIRDDDDRRNGYSPDGKRDRSPRRGGYDRVRSPSPYRRERGSPDYGGGRGRSPSPYHRERASPDYARGSNRSPSRKERDSENGRGPSPSPRRDRESDYDRRRNLSPSPRRERESDYDRKRHLSPSPRRERESDYDRKQNLSSSSRRERVSDFDRKRNPSPSPRRERESDYDRKRNLSPSPRRERESDYDRKRNLSLSPGREGESEFVHKPRMERESEYNHKQSPSPRREGEPEYDHGRSPTPKRERSNGDIDRDHYEKRAGADYGRSPSPSPSPRREQGERVESPDNYAHARTPYSDAESPPAE